MKRHISILSDDIIYLDGEKATPRNTPKREFHKIKSDISYFQNQIHKRTYQDQTIQNMLKIAKVNIQNNCFVSFAVKRENIILYAETNITFALTYEIERLAFSTYGDLAMISQDRNSPERRKIYEQIRKRAKNLSQDLVEFDSLASYKLLIEIDDFVEEKDKYFASSSVTGKRYRKSPVKREFVFGLFDIWQTTLGKRVGYSRSSESANAKGGKVTGPLLRFIQLALQAVGDEIKPETLADWCEIYRATNGIPLRSPA